MKFRYKDVTPSNGAHVPTYCDDAIPKYGERDEKLIWNVDKSQLPADLDPQKGQMLQSVQEDGTRINVKVTDVTDTNVTLDANHPLAGEDLVFEVELMEIV